MNSAGGMAAPPLLEAFEILAGKLEEMSGPPPFPIIQRTLGINPDEEETARPYAGTQTGRFSAGPRPEKDDDLVNHPQHYGGDSTYEVIKVLEAWEIENPRIFNAIKYLARAGRKDGHPYKQDLQKAAWYLAREIDRLE
jgi:hypothetical protein